MLKLYDPTKDQNYEESLFGGRSHFSSLEHGLYVLVSEWNEERSSWNYVIDIASLSHQISKFVRQTSKQSFFTHDNVRNDLKILLSNVVELKEYRRTAIGYFDSDDYATLYKLLEIRHKTGAEYEWCFGGVTSPFNVPNESRNKEMRVGWCSEFLVSQPEKLGCLFCQEGNFVLIASPNQEVAKILLDLDP